MACHQAGHTATLSVADNGIGIAPENLPRVFERFYTGDGELAGTGLGLSIARSLVQAMHGEIRLESRPGEGTRVTRRSPRGSGSAHCLRAPLRELGRAGPRLPAPSPPGAATALACGLQ